MLSLLEDLPSTLLSNSHMQSALSQLAFVPTASGVLTAPQNLYDPRTSELQALLDPSKAFADEPFDSVEVCWPPIQSRQ